MEISSKLLSCLFITPMLMIFYYVIYLLPVIQSNSEVVKFQYMSHGSTHSSTSDTPVEHKQRCQANGINTAVNHGNNLYTTKPFQSVSATSLGTMQQLSSFMDAFNPPTCFRVLAIMAGYNEEDVLLSSISDLIAQDIDVHFIDNWSTDNSFNVVKRLQRLYPDRISLERFPEQDDKIYNWAAILQRKTQLAMRTKADWVIHVDPDELRESPWGAEVSLLRALYVADELGYNLANFGNVLVFQPLNTTLFSRKKSLRDSFLHYLMNKFSGDSKQSKAWKTYYSTCSRKQLLPKRVAPDLAASGGHILQYSRSIAYSFPEHKLFPFTFFLRHYPIRSQEHGARKVFAERNGRWNVSERDSLDWHKQYDSLHQGHNFVGDARELSQVLDSGDLPIDLLSSFLPCRTQS
mmetsp:Transcript_25324/g.47365  ORF Transcript_25324/g.47365 Transcript_25324/m.47365 type:complete len:406 (+) Transcript_25324:300-1517(+)